MMGAIRSSEPSVLTGATRSNISEDGSLDSHAVKNFKYYISLTGWAL
jgi:hypothetical protein